MSRTPSDLLLERHRDYAKACERAQRATEASQRAQERVHELEARLATHELSPGEAEKLRQVVAKAKAEHESAAYATSCANQELDRMPAERRGDWLRRAQADFQARRATYEQLISDLAEAREQLAQEAALIDALLGKPTVRMSASVRVRADDIEGHGGVDVRVRDVLAALRAELADLELRVLLGARA